MSANPSRVRGTIKSKLSCFNNFVRKCESKSDETELTETEVQELKLRMEKVSGLLNDFENIQSQIEASVEDDELEHQFEERTEFEESYFAILSRAKVLADRYAPEVEIPSPRSRASTASNASLKNSANKQERAQTAIRLPTIDLPKFDGNYEHWLEFKDTFESLIHHNESITSDIQKFHYLRSSLAGSAIEVIKSFEFSADNYQAAWEILCARFNNKHLLIQRHIDAIFTMETVKETSTSVRKTVDTVSKHLRALESLGQSVDKWDTLLIYLLAKKLQSETLGEWEKYRLSKGNDISLADMLEFMRSRADFLETIHSSERKPKVFNNKGIRSLVMTNLKCPICSGDHPIHKCETFQKLSVNERSARVKQNNLCYNCLGKGHLLRSCKSRNCKVCSRKHHSLLHITSETEREENMSPTTLNMSETQSHVVAHTVSPNFSCGQVLLATAIVRIADSTGKMHAAHALLDPGSQSSFITQNFQEKLGLDKSEVTIGVSGINSGNLTITHRCVAKTYSRNSSFRFDTSYLIIPEITGALPNFKFSTTSLNIPTNISLADPSFNIPAPIDVLLGADCFWNLLCVGQIKLTNSNSGIVLQKTKLGWVLTGPLHSLSPKVVQCTFSKNVALESQLTKFWEIEDCQFAKILSKEELECESHFQKTYERDLTGRFTVSIPFREDVSQLGDSYTNAERRFKALESKLQRNPHLKDKYVEFMDEYESLQHMTEVGTNDITPQQSFYIPHHGVLNESKMTTKLRVVFDASAPSSTGVSLNELQMVGPTIQQDLFSILIRFRQHAFAVSADIEKMYRQVLINPSQRAFQRILWRKEPTLPLKCFELNTVTYGTTAAPFLAIRSLYQLGMDCEHTLPHIANIIKNDFYVDDLLTGADSPEQAEEIVKSVSNVLSSGGFNLRKWVSNQPEILTNSVPSCEQPLELVILSDATIKTLGLYWNSVVDSIIFEIKLPESTFVTKRYILSAISKIFDPIGLLSPCIITAKVMLQKLWQEGASWDESVSSELYTQWISYRNSLSSLNNVRIPRHVTLANRISIQLHGFSDASEVAYGACVYVRTETTQEVVVKLLCSKTRVAPLKRLTIPRLELCGAVILANLVKKVTSSLAITFDQKVYWTDSTIVLGWLKHSPNNLQIFVGNRVSQIQNITTIDNWRHVPTECNPADFLSRGVKPSELPNLATWWNGPKFLVSDQSSWPRLSDVTTNLPEVRKESQVVFVVNTMTSDLFTRYSSLSRLQRVIAYCRRFFTNVRRVKAQRTYGNLTTCELHDALTSLTKLAQSESFPQEISQLKSGKCLDSKSKLQSLTPFLDSQENLRVGGRLKNSAFAYDKRHPVLLDHKHPFTHLVLTHEHIRLLHAGPQTLLASVRERFWPTRGRNLAKKVVKMCTKCFRANPMQTNPLMGNLPRERTQPSVPFSITGTDYAGPFNLKDRKGRGSKTNKCYVAVFICFSTKAIHLELVSDLTTEAFLASLRRFSSRRGKPSKIYSDNGKNFVGANADLKQLGKFLQDSNNRLCEQAAQEGIAWSFIPPYAPHFGGLWEAGVKSFKWHLKRVASTAHLTYEEFSTLLCQVEAVLNSRPLYPISADPNDLASLTPAHFLIGKRLVSVPDYDYTEIPDNRLSRFQLIQKLRTHFWNRWSKEYVSELQKRSKWRNANKNLRSGTLVLIKDENLPPMCWKLGRILECFPGNDDITRVVTVRTASGVLKRAVTKICPLPVSGSIEESE